MNTQLACPHCQSIVKLTFNGNTQNTPLVCASCGQAFAPHFYCPDARSPARHIFVAQTLYVDNHGVIYTFCPAHTLTTYAVLVSYMPHHKPTPLAYLIRFFSSLAFRLALTVESLRLRALAVLRR